MNEWTCVLRQHRWRTRLVRITWEDRMLILGWVLLQLCRIFWEIKRKRRRFRVPEPYR